MSILGSVFSILAQMAVWYFIFHNDPNMIRYMTSYVIVAQIISILLNNNISNLIGDKVTTGSFVVDLLKPLNPTFAFFSNSFGMTLAQLLNRGLLLIIVFGAFLHFSPGVEKVLYFIITCVLGYIIANLIYFIIGYLSFIVFEVWPYVRLINDTVRLLAGGVIPLAFFPAWLASGTKLLPFQYLYSFPIRILLENIPTSEIYTNYAIMMVWIILLSSLLVLTYRSVIKHCVIQGG